MTTTNYRLTRLSIVGYECTHCGAIMGEALRCPGCSWTDPMTRMPKKQKQIMHDLRDINKAIHGGLGEELAEALHEVADLIRSGEVSGDDIAQIIRKGTE